MTEQIIHLVNQFNNSAFVHIGARYVFYSTLALNTLAAGERIFFIFETKIGIWFPSSKIPPKLSRVEYVIEFVTDVIEALGQLNFKDGIRPRRFNKRSTDDTQNGTVAQQNSSAQATAGK